MARSSTAKKQQPTENELEEQTPQTGEQSSTGNNVASFDEAKKAKEASSDDAEKGEVSEDRHGQGILPNQRPVAILEVDQAAKSYANARDARIAAGQKEKAAEKLLDALMEKHELDEYHIGDVHVEPKQTAKKWTVKIGGDSDPKDEKPSNASTTKKSSSKSKKTGVMDKY